MADLPPLPPGFTIDQQGPSAVPPLPPGFQVDQQQAAPATAAPPQAAPISPFQRFLKSGIAFGGLGEPALHVAGNMVGAPIAGLAGIGAGITNATGLTNTPAGNVVENVADFFNYQPRTDIGKAITAGVDYPFKKLAQGADAAGGVAGGQVPALPVKDMAPVSYSPGSGGWPMAGRAENPLVSTAINTGIQALPSLLLRGPKGAKATVAAQATEAPKPVITPRQALIDELVAKDIKVTPTQAEARGGSLVEGLAGHAKLERSVSLKNAKRVNELVAEDVGLKGAKNITEGDLTRLKVEANKPYNAIARTGTRKTSDQYRQEVTGIGDRTGGESFKGDVPRDIKRLKRFYAGIEQFTAQDAVNKIRQLRSEASKNIKAINAPEQNAKGHVQRAIAEALDNELTRHAESIGKPELAANYKAARVQLAKLHTLEDALDGSNISARELAKAKDRGAPLSGNMDLVARAATEFDRSFQDVSKIRDSSPFGAIDLGASVVGGAVNPLLTAAIVARPIARAALASKKYQGSLAGRSKAQKATGTSKPQAQNSLATPYAANALAASAQGRSK